MTMLAEKLYKAYSDAVADDGATLMPWSKLNEDRERGRAWFLLAGMVDEVRKPPKTVEPFDYELTVPVEPRRMGDVFKNPDGSPLENPDELVPEKLPASLHIRPMRGSDLCRREFEDGNAAFNAALLAHIHGVDLAMLDDRIDMGDADAAEVLIAQATGKDAWQFLRDAFIIAGGKVFSADGEQINTLVTVTAWRMVALALLSVERTKGQHAYIDLVCRTAEPLSGDEPGVLKIGPLRVRHVREHEDVAMRRTEYDGRFAALALATGVDVGKLGQMRIEDIDRAWACFEILKKKAADRARSAVAARQSSLSTGGDGTMSETSPSPS